MEKLLSEYRNICNELQELRWKRHDKEVQLINSLVDRKLHHCLKINFGELRREILNNK
jgi:hypothetical protein